ncbi:MAG TPA: hypothetical protein PK765_06120 [bacterium]|nr:hypothetical protein [bacterium]
MCLSRSGYSSIIAMLMTAFLVALSAGVLSVMVQNAGVSRTVLQGTEASIAAESGLEYALLKIRNHRAGFEDRIAPDDRERTLISALAADIPAEMRYDIDAAGTAYSGTLAPGEFAVFSLFTDPGVPTGTGSKHPNPTGYRAMVPTSGFVFSADGDFAWNIIASDSAGQTYGIVGTGSLTRPVGSDTSAVVSSGTRKDFDATAATFDLSSQTIASFLSAYENAYFVVQNYTGTDRVYSMSAATDFGFPAHRIVASGIVGNIRQNVALQEDSNRLFEVLKYSLFAH